MASLTYGVHARLCASFASGSCATFLGLKRHDSAVERGLLLLRYHGKQSM